MFPQPYDPFSTSQSRRNFIKYSISEDTWKTKSGSAIIRSMQEELGVAIRREDFFAVRREKFEEFARREEFAKIPDDHLVPYSLMNTDTNITLTNTAQYRLRMTVKDPKTDELSYVYRSIGSDEHHTRGYIEKFASEMFSMGGRGYEYNIVSVELHDVWLAEGGHLTG